MMIDANEARSISVNIILTRVIKEIKSASKRGECFIIVNGCFDSMADGSYALFKELMEGLGFKVSIISCRKTIVTW